MKTEKFKITNLLQEKKNCEYLAEKLESILTNIDCISSNQAFDKDDAEKIEQTIETFLMLQNSNFSQQKLIEKLIIQKLNDNAAEN